MGEKIKTILFTICLAILMPIGYGLMAFVSIGLLIAPFYLFFETLLNFSYLILIVDFVYVGFVALVLWKYGERIPKMVEDFWKQIWNNY